MHDAKQRAAEAALAWTPTHGVVGLGTGSTAELFIRALAARGTTDIRGVATSCATAELARHLGLILPDEATRGPSTCASTGRTACPCTRRLTPWRATHTI